MSDEVAEVWLTDKGTKQGINNLFSQCGHNTGERGTDDDSDSKVHDVAAQDEVAKAFKHVRTCEMKFY